MAPILIKIGHQNQAKEPIYLISSGHIICGNYKYSGKLKKDFKKIYEYIVESVKHRRSDKIIDVSDYKIWDAMDIYDNYIAKPWKKSLGAKTLEKLAIETYIFLKLETVREEFKRDVAATWKRIFRKSDVNDPATPTQGWHLFRNPRIQ